MFQSVRPWRSVHLPLFLAQSLVRRSSVDWLRLYRVLRGHHPTQQPTRLAAASAIPERTRAAAASFSALEPTSTASPTTAAGLATLAAGGPATHTPALATSASALTRWHQ